MLAVAEEAIEAAVEGIGGVGVGVGDPTNQIQVVSEHAGRGNTQRGIVGQEHAG